MKFYIGKPLHTGISVYHMDKSIIWYEKNLGFKVRKDNGFIPALGARVVFLEKDGYEIELFEYRKPTAIPEERLDPNADLQTVGTKHVAFQTSDMDRLKKRFVENGVDIALECRMDGASVMFVRDCNGVLIEFIG